MALNIRTVMTYPLDGSNVNFTITFEYLARKFITVTLLGTDRKELVLNQDYRFTSKNQITLTKAWGPSDGYENIEIRRFTSATERLVDFADGSILRAYDLNISQVQTLHVAEEARDLTADTIGVNNDGNLDARGRRIVNLADGVDAGDAVTIRQQQTWADSALNQANRANTEADRSKTEADRSKTEADRSAAAAAASKTSETNAKTSETNAKTSETNAKTSETNSASSATASASSKDAAKVSELAAAASALSAKNDADRAQTANPDNQLKKASNLSDVESVPTSRNNLSVYSKAEVDALVSQGNTVVLSWAEAVTLGWLTLGPLQDAVHSPLNIVVIKPKMIEVIGTIARAASAQMALPVTGYYTIIKVPSSTISTWTRVSTPCTLLTITTSGATILSGASIGGYSVARAKGYWTTTMSGEHNLSVSGAGPSTAGAIVHDVYTTS